MRTLAVIWIGRDFYAAATKFVVQEPGARGGAAVLMWRLEFPVPCRLESDAREVGARTVRGVFGVGHRTAWVDVDANDDANCTVNRVAGTLRDIGHIAIEYIAARG